MGKQLPFDGFYTTEPPHTILNKQGQQANFSGSAAEDIIFNMLKNKGYSVKRQYKLRIKSLHGGLPGWSAISRFFDFSL